MPFPDKELMKPDIANSDPSDYTATITTPFRVAELNRGICLDSLIQ